MAEAETLKFRPAVQIDPESPYQTARQIRTRFAISEPTLRKLALGGLIRHQTTTAVVNLYSVEDVDRIVRDQGRIPAEQPRAAIATK